MKINEYHFSKVKVGTSILVDFSLYEHSLTRYNSVSLNSFRLRKDRDSIKTFLVRMLALNELIKPLRFRVDNRSGVELRLLKHIGYREVEQHRITVYLEHEGELEPVMDNEFLDNLPLEIGNIIREIEADRENLIKKCLFEWSLAGFEIKTISDLTNRKHLVMLKEGIESNER